jgi:hypothetical protein
LGDSAGAAILENIRVWALILSGQIGEALRLAEHNKREMELLGSTWLAAQALDVLSITQLITGELDQARETLHQTLTMPDITGKWIYHFLFDDLALAQLATGEVAEAQRTLDEAPPTVGIWQALDRLMVRAAVALAQGDTTTATTLANKLAEQAAAVDYQLYVQRAARLVEAIANPPPLAELPRFLWVDG